MSRILKKKLKNQLETVRIEQAVVKVGKNGLSETVIAEVFSQLEKHMLIKIKFLSNFLTDDFDADIKKLAKKTSSQLVEKRGKTVILYKPRET